jgi:MoaA/NifB/PqqE/SkfB family radical SAM enzyme
MECPFCFVPFDAETTSARAVRDAFSATLANLQPTSITIGGGDPLMFRDLDSILEIARERTEFVQLDTNAKALGRNRITVLRNYVDLLGLPLESARADIHDRLRAEDGHFDRVFRAIRDAVEISLPVKINTVLTAENRSGVAQLGSLIQASGAVRWSLYEFWNMEPVPGPPSRFAIEYSRFLSAIEEARQAAPNVRVETGSSVSARKASYVFVRHTGGVYVISQKDHRKYIELGSIFEIDIRDRILAHFNRAQQKARLRERMGQ